MKANDLAAPQHRGAGCLFYIPSNRNFLLIKRSSLVSMPNTWCLPGGSAEKQELPAHAACREAYEEIGYQVDPSTLSLIYTNETHAPKFKFYTFACIIDKKFEPRLNWESVDYLWCTIDELPDPLHWGLTQLFNSDRAAKRLVNLTAQNTR